MQALGAGDCADVERLGDVASLNLADQGLTALRAGDFDGLTNLKQLGLTGNQLTALPAGVFAMHDVLPRAADGRLVAETFNPGSNGDQVSRLRLVNTGTTPENVRIEGFDDQGAISGLVGLRLAAGESRTLSALDLENGAQGLAGRLGDGAGKWRLFIAAGDSVVGMSLLEAASGYLTNISTMDIPTTEGQ